MMDGEILNFIFKSGSKWHPLFKDLRILLGKSVRRPLTALNLSIYLEMPKY